MMVPASVDRALLGENQELIQMANDLDAIGQQFASIPYPLTVPNDDTKWPGVSRRCKALACANVLRGEELLRFAILAVNEGAIIAAQLLTRALDETCSALFFARLRIERALKDGDAARLVETLNRLTCGNKFMSRKDSSVLEPFNVLTMVDETGKYLRRRAEAKGAKIGDTWRDHYEFRSEFVHPSMGSFSVYQRPQGDNRVFERKLGLDPSPFLDLLSGLRASADGVLTEAERLSQIQDPTADWPGFEGRA